jgi:multidrug resistance efflux pump
MEKMRKSLALALAIIVMLTAGACDALTDDGGNQIKASGIVEVTEIAVASELGGKVISVHVDEGDSVDAGDTLLILDDSILAVQRDQAVAAVASAQAGLDSALAGKAAASAMLDAAIAQVEMATIQLGMEVAAANVEYRPERVNSWSRTQSEPLELPKWYFEQAEEISAARLVLEEAEENVVMERAQYTALLEDIGGEELVEAEEKLIEARAIYKIADELWKRLAVGDEGQDIRNRIREIHDQAIDDLENAQEAMDDLLADDEAEDLLEARSDLTVAQEQYQITQEYYLSLLVGEHNLRVQAAKLVLTQAEAGVTQGEAALAQIESQIQSAEYALTQAEAMLATVDLQIEKMTIQAPASGVVLVRSVEAGEVLAPGMAALSLGDLEELFITVYVPENRYGEIRLGDAAQVSVDSFPDEVFDAVVVRIADQAEFTPRNVQTEEDRQTTVYAVEVRVLEPQGKLKPGMPADVVFDTSG